MRGLLLRSTSDTPLDVQSELLTRIADVVAANLESPLAQADYLKACFDSGLLGKSGYKRRPGEHPANFTALAMASVKIDEQHGALLSDVVHEFCSWKQLVLNALHQRFGNTVYVPDFFAVHQDFSGNDKLDDEHSHPPSSNRTWTDVADYICESLNVIRLPVWRDAHWRVAVLPNLVGARDADVSTQVGYFYELLERREQMGDALSAEDVKNLKVFWLRSR